MLIAPDDESWLFRVSSTTNLITSKSYIDRLFRLPTVRHQIFMPERLSNSIYVKTPTTMNFLFNPPSNSPNHPTPSKWSNSKKSPTKNSTSLNSAQKTKKNGTQMTVRLPTHPYHASSPIKLTSRPRIRHLLNSVLPRRRIPLRPRPRPPGYDPAAPTRPPDKHVLYGVRPRDQGVVVFG